MSLYIYAEPDRPELFNEDEEEAPPDPVVAPFADHLREAYQRRVELYHRELVRQFAGQPADSSEPPASAYLRVMLPAEQDWEAEEIVLDADLFSTLFDLYLLEGWAPINRLETVLEMRSKAKSLPHRPAAGTPELQAYAAYTFFRYCRNTLALLVRESLMDLERRAAVQIIARLSVTSAKVAAAVTAELGITRRQVTVEGVPGESQSAEVSFYAFAHQELIRTLMSAVGDAVAARVAYERLLESITHLQEALRRVNARINRGQRRGIQPPAQQVADRERLTATLRQQAELRSASEGYYAAMKKVIGLNCPLALLVVDGLRPGFRQPQLERVLGEAIWEIYERLDDLARGIDPVRSQVDALLAGLPASDRGRISLDAVQRLKVPAAGPERAVIDAAISGLSSAPAWIPMLHEMTWRLLVQQGEITKDSFEYVVMHHYLDELGDRLDEVARGQEDMAKFFRAFSKVSAALSVALLVTPLAEVAPALRTAGGVADLAVLAYQVSSVTGQLSQLDDALTQKLLDADAYAMPSLARIGELMLVRSELGEQLPELLLLELLGVIAAGAWVPVRKLMVTRGFLTDMETIIGTDDADA